MARGEPKVECRNCQYFQPLPIKKDGKAGKTEYGGPRRPRGDCTNEDTDYTMVKDTFSCVHFRPKE